MPQVVISAKVFIVLGILIFLLTHLALYYSTGFNLIKATIETVFWLFDKLKWLINSLKGLEGA